MYLRLAGGITFGKRAFAGHDGGWLVFAETGEVPDGLLERSSAAGGGGV